MIMMERSDADAESTCASALCAVLLGVPTRGKWQGHGAARRGEESHGRQATGSTKCGDGMGYIV